MYLIPIIAEKYKLWKNNSRIFLEAPTGKGKTTFILEKLLLFAIEQGREILYLSNREVLHKELIKICCNKFGIPYE